MAEPAPGLRGVGVSPGVAVGPVASMGGGVPEPPAAPRSAGRGAGRQPRNPAAEAEAAAAALEAVAADLEARGDRAGGPAGPRPG